MWQTTQKREKGTRSEISVSCLTGQMKKSRAELHIDDSGHLCAKYLIMYLSVASIQMTVPQIGLCSPTLSFHKYFLNVFHFLVYETKEETTIKLCLLQFVFHSERQS